MKSFKIIDSFDKKGSDGYINLAIMDGELVSGYMVRSSNCSKYYGEEAVPHYLAEYENELYHCIRQEDKIKSHMKRKKEEIQKKLGTYLENWITCR